MSLADVALPVGLDGHHVLLLPHGTDVLALASAWFPDATWVRPPVEAVAAARPMTGARFRGMAPAAPARPTPGALRLDPGSGLEGPVLVDPLSAAALGAGSRELDGYALVATPQVPTWTDGSAVDPTEVAAAWTTAAARRVGGAVLPADRERLVLPDPASAVDLTLWSPVPLSATDAVPLVRPALHGARLGPVDVPHPSAVPGTFSFAATFEYDGAVLVQAERSAEAPAVLSSLDWRESGPWSYRVTWQPPVPEELGSDHPSPLHVIARSRVAPTVAGVAAALWRGAGGTVVDAGGFLVSAAELRDRASAPVR